MSKLVAIVGNTSVGKTTLTQQLNTVASFKIGLEYHAERPFQQLFAHDRQRYALANQIDYLLLRAEQESAMRHGSQIGLLDGGLDEDFFVFTRHFSRKGYLQQTEYELCERLYRFIRASLPPPDLIIYLTAPLNVLARRYAQRGRPLEIAALSDLADLQLLVEEWLHNVVATPVITVDVGEHDPELRAVVPQVLAAIEHMR